jgi:hypothetical protein
MKTLGIILIVIGLGLTIFTTATIFTRKNVMVMGNMEITRDKPHHLNWSPLIGIAVLGIGGVILWQASKKT